MAKKTTLNKTLQKAIGNKFLQCLLLALAFTALSLYSLYFTWTLANQESIVSATGYKKKIAQHEKSKLVDRTTITRDFLLIDVSNDMTLHCDPDAATKTGTPTDTDSLLYMPCTPQVDLKKIMALFKWLSDNQDNYNVVVCDLLIDTLPLNNETDTLLGCILNIIQQNPGKILFAGLYDKHTGRFGSSPFSDAVPPTNKGVVNEDLTENYLLKYELSYKNGQIKSLPLLMLEKINHYTIQPYIPGFDKYTSNDGNSITAANLFIPEMLFLNDDIDSIRTTGSYDGSTLDSSAGKIQLYQTLLPFNNINNYSLREVLYTQSPNKRNIFIGAFNHNHNDMHKTIYENMDGSIILLNIYYNLLLNSNKVSVGYNLFVFVFFCCIFLKILVWPRLSFRSRFTALNMVVYFIYNNIQYLILLTIATLSSTLFNKAINSIILFTALFIVDNIIQGYRESRQKA